LIRDANIVNAQPKTNSNSTKNSTRRTRTVRKP
jgi:hypothetical protein